MKSSSCQEDTESSVEGQRQCVKGSIAIKGRNWEADDRGPRGFSSEAGPKGERSERSKDLPNQEDFKGNNESKD